MDDALESSEWETAGDQPRVKGRCAWCGPVTFILADLQVHVGDQRYGPTPSFSYVLE